MRLDEHGVLQGAEGAGVVTRALAGDAQPALAGVADDSHDVPGGPGEGDGGGPLVDGQVPGPAGVVEGGVGGEYQFGVPKVVT